MHPETIFVPFHLVVVEDEKQILEDVLSEMKSVLQRICPVDQGDREGPGVGPERGWVRVEPRVWGIDNIQDARRMVSSGRCDVLMADFKVREVAEGAKGKASMVPLLREIRRGEGHIRVIGHTAYQDLLESAMQDDLTVTTISKRRGDSREQFIAEGEDVARRVLDHKNQVCRALAALKVAAYCESVVDKQGAIARARELLGKISFGLDMPRQYRKALVLLRACILRVSSVPSERFGLREVTPEFVDVVEPLMMRLAAPRFSYEKDARPVFVQLDANGYEVMMRVGDEAE